MSINDMQELAKKRGGKCLSKKYINDRNKLLWQCSEGHTWNAVPYSIKAGSWCPKCAGLIKLTIKDMQKLAKERGGKCLSKEYINNNTKLKWQCSNGHIWEATASHIKNGEWCIECKKGKIGYNKKGTIEEMKKLAEKKGGKCLSEKYIKNLKKIKWQCSNGHIWEDTPYNVKNLGKWCPICLNEEKYKNKLKIISK